MKVAFPLLITVNLFVQGAFACTIDYTPIEELIEDADHIFIGYVVEINYVDYEAYIKETDVYPKKRIQVLSS